MGYPRPNWFIFNRVSLLPAVGIFLIGAGIVEGTLWLVGAGVAALAAGTWLTMRRLSGRISARSLEWIAVDTLVVLAGGAVALALHLSGVALVAVVAVPAVASDMIATALTGVREVQ